MPNMFLGFPFDPELFLLQWSQEQDPVKLAMLQSGAVTNSAEIRRMIANGSNLYTIPFYDVLGGTPDNYDGESDITMSEPSGKYQTGVVYGRAHSWKDRDFVHDFNSGADPMKVITSQVAKFWQKKRQQTMLKILNGVFGISAPTGADATTTALYAAWRDHTYNIAAAKPSSGSATISDDNKFGATTLGDAVQKALGDNASIVSMVWMHSRVAQNLANLQLLQFRKYTDPQGIERTLQIADLNGITVIVDDDCPVVDSEAATGAKEYTSYVMGASSLLYAPAPVKNPSEVGREELTGGGYDFLVTRLRETYHPNGFIWTMPAGTDGKLVISPTDAQLGAAANWSLATNPKLIPMVKIVTNG